MVIKVGINGFGRIGRVIFRTCLQNPNIELSAINDPAIDIEYICYLIKFDSTHGKFKGNITHTEDQINIDDRLIKVFRDKLPHTVPWQVAGVQYVIEASGMFTCLEKSSGHLASDCVKRVIVTAPSGDVPMIILGVNDDKLSADQKIVSCTSSTLYCLAPIVKVLEDTYGVSEGFITSIHAMTPSLKPLDGLCMRGKHWRDHRSIHQNIIPASTGSCNALAKIIPQVKDKMTGLAFRVPIVNVSVLDLTVRLNISTSLQHIMKTVEKASNTNLQNIIKISNEEAVSSDFNGDSHSCIFDADCSLQLKPNFYKIICWYENEYSYACRVVDTIFFSERQFNKPLKNPVSKMTYVRAKVLKKQEEIQTEHSLSVTLSTECNTEISKVGSLLESPLKRKPFVRPIVIRKPMITHSSAASTIPVVNRDTKKRNELFKIWNDNNESQKNAARQNRGSFFHSCISFVPKLTENSDCSKAQERLENVKREFSKMVNITEDLLKKSNTSSRMQAVSTTKSSLQEVLGANEGVKESKANINIKLNDQPAKDSVFDTCGDFNNRPATESNNEEKRSNSSELKENRADYNIENTVKKNDSKKSLLLSPQEKNTRLAKQNSVTQIGQEATFQNKLSGNTNALLKKNVKSLSKESIHQIAKKEHKDITPKASNNAVKSVEENKGIAEGNKSPMPVEKVNTQECDSQENINQNELNKYLHNKDHNMQVIDEELQKRNIVLLNNQQKEQQNNTEINLKSSSTTTEKGIAEPNKRRKYFSKHIFECLNKKVSGITSRDEPVEARPSGIVAGSSSGNGARIKPDLYDKLDSASATDSNNSFEITERKSQVIHITDLTNSLDDLVRLDKICRIIEISDDLSDQLFSSLDQSELMVQQKNWSFRDLCERIKLDDFCNKVFGHSRS